MVLPIKYDEVENKIIEVRKTKVILDCDVAKLYGVATRDINKSVKNNLNKFPSGYMFELTTDEKLEVVEIFHHFHKLKFSAQLPKAFTEKGLYMLATILKSQKATETTFTIIETFERFKNLSRNIKELSNIQGKKEKQNLVQKSGDIITQILEDDLSLNETETSIELNFAVLKFKHTVKRNKDEKK